jgi:D-3-phosphoglycerate dehydrogenase
LQIKQACSVYLNLNAGYATGVLFGQLNIKNYLLINYASTIHNVIITPYIGGNTFESIEKTENFIALKFQNNFFSKI